MFRRPELYRNESDFLNPNSFGELDLRLEFDILIYGDANHIPHGFPIVIRQMRRDSNDKRVECVCRDQRTLDPDLHCSYCLGEGFLWDEYWTVTFREFIGSDGGLSNRGRWLPAGEIRVDDKLFFFRYDTPIRLGDKIVEVKLDIDGNPIVPYVRQFIHSPKTVYPFRSDGGRVEYIATYCREDDIRTPDL